MPGAIDRLIRLVAHVDVVIYPLRPAPRRATHVSIWLVAQLLRFFATADHPEPHKAVAGMMDLLEIVDHRPADLDAIVEAWADGPEALEPARVAANMARLWAAGPG